MGIVDRTNWTQVDMEFRHKLINEYNIKAVKFLQQLGEKVVKYARNDESSARHYTDRTGNLRSSIGYVVVQEGRVVAESFNGNNEGSTTGRKYAIDVASGLPKNKTYLVWVAGMDYARYVEAMGFDVIQGSGDWIESRADAEREAFKRYLNSNRR